MKKDTLFFACLSLLALCGMLFSNARAQETAEAYPVSLYGLTTAEAAPEHPAEGWTEFQMPTLGESGRDTLTKTYLRTDAAPLNITTQTEVTLNAIGFDFPYGGRTVTHFGVTGNGLIYLAAAEAAEPAETAGEVKRALTYATTPMSLEDAIAAFPQCGTRPYTVYNVADAKTKVGYYEGGEADSRYLVVGFRNMLVSFAGSDKKDYEIRLTYDVILHADGRIMFRFVDLSLSADEQKQLLFAYGLFGQKGEQAICASDWKGGLKRQASGSPFARMAVAAEAVQAVLTYTVPQKCAAPQDVTATATVKDLYSNDFSGVTLQIGTGCDGWLVLVSDDEAMTERPEDGRVYKSGGFTPDSIGGFPVRLVGNTSKNFNNINGLQSNTSYYIYMFIRTMKSV